MSPQSTRLSDELERQCRFVATAVRRLLTLSNGEFKRALDSFVRFEPTTPTISADEVSEWAFGDTVPAEDLVAMIKIANFLNFEIVDFAKELEDVSERISTYVRDGRTKADVQGLLEQILPPAQALEKKVGQVGALAAPMPSFLSCKIAHDLRYIPNPQETESRFTPIAIVRIELDEEKDAIFQCSSRALARLSRALEEAIKTMRELEKSADEKSKN